MHIVNDSTDLKACKFGRCKFPRTCEWNQKCIQVDLNISLKTKQEGSKKRKKEKPTR